MDEIMKKQEEVTYDQVMQMITEYFDAFKTVLKIGSPVSKQIALRQLSQLQQACNEQVEEYEMGKGIQFSRLMQLLEMPGVNEYVMKVNPDIGNFIQSTKETMMGIKEEVGPLLDKAKGELEKPKAKSHRKRKMENRMRSKE